MIKRKPTVFLFALLSWTTAMAVFGSVNMPTGVLPYALAHEKGFVYQLFVIWLLVPASILLVLAIGPVAALGPFGAFFSRLFNRGREVPPDREKWATRVVVVAGLFLAFGQAWQTLALALLWHKRHSPWVARAMHGPHVYGIPDPHHLILRLWPAAAGVLIAWLGNGLPKLLTPFRGVPEPYDWGNMMRACGWALTVGGFAAAACSLFISDVSVALLSSAAILVASLVATFPIWAVYRFGSGRGGAIPPERL